MTLVPGDLIRLSFRYRTALNRPSLFTGGNEIRYVERNELLLVIGIGLAQLDYGDDNFAVYVLANNACACVRMAYFEKA